jgi:hypothetical protein
VSRKRRSLISLPGLPGPAGTRDKASASCHGGHRVTGYQPRAEMPAISWLMTSIKLVLSSTHHFALNSVIQRDPSLP